MKLSSERQEIVRQKLDKRFRELARKYDKQIEELKKAWNEPDRRKKINDKHVDHMEAIVDYWVATYLEAYERENKIPDQTDCAEIVLQLTGLVNEKTHKRDLTLPQLHTLFNDTEQVRDDILSDARRTLDTAALEVILKKQSDSTPRFSDGELMRRAIDLARKCDSEPGKVSPKVGAIVARDGVILGEAYRGELAPGDHAEFTLLEKKLGGETLAGATLFTTLEPCTKRSHTKIPCAERVIERKLGRVFVGTLDRNPDIRGRGEFLMEDAGIQFARFDPELIPILDELNREFLRQYREDRIERTPAETKDPVEPDSVGPNGFKIGYAENGDKVEWIIEDSETWPLILRRNDKDILNEYNELWEKVWYIRKLIHQEKMERGEIPYEDQNKPHLIKAQERMRQIEEKYGVENLGWSDIEWGIVQGKLSALSWVMGSEWEGSMDT